MKKRIWELDAFRGLCLLGMIGVHLVYDLTVLYKLITWQPPDIFVFVQRWGGLLFLLLSGICVTLGSHSARRGIIVFAAGLVVSAVTYGMYRFGFAGKSIVIYFGVLHCLGVCMLLWVCFRKLPWWALAILGLALVALGLYFQTLTVENPWLFPLGLETSSFASSDYFPVLPNFGYFLLGAVLGKTLYRRKETLFPGANPQNPILRFLRWMGRHSLWIYLLHQPILNGICMLILEATK